MCGGVLRATTVIRNAVEEEVEAVAGLRAHEFLI
jgi:hypothetical protein